MGDQITKTTNKKEEKKELQANVCELQFCRVQYMYTYIIIQFNAHSIQNIKTGQAIK